MIVKLIGSPEAHQTENLCMHAPETCMHAPETCMQDRFLAIFSEMVRVRMVIFSENRDGTYVHLMIMVLTK